jgi:hypothetical protein
MTFWNNTVAAPTILTTLPWADKRPRHFRTTPAAPLPDTLSYADGKAATLRRLFGSDALVVSQFLERNYGDKTWQIRGVQSWIWNYLSDASVVALGLFNGPTLIGTIFSVPATTGRTIMSHGGVVEGLRVIEGLCVAAPHRTQGIASFLIKHADAFTSHAFGPTAHLWAREVDSGSFYFSTALRCDLYGYTVCGAAAVTPRLQTMEWSEFEAAWITASPAWAASATSPTIVVTVPSNRRMRHRVFHNNGLIVVISDTERCANTNTPIYEIVWSGRWGGGVLSPSNAADDFEHLLQDVSAALPARSILFGTTSHTGGGLRYGMAGWILGRSGAHALYLYNYMPPSFGNCIVHMVRDEL